MSVTIESGGQLITEDNLLEALSSAAIFDVERSVDGRFYFSDGAEGCFGATLTRDQVLALADELRDLAISGPQGSQAAPTAG